MKVSSSARAIAVLSLSAALGGCMFSAHGASGGPQFSVMFITREPPPLRVEVVTTRHSEEEVWIGGHWSARNNDYAWVSGRWARPENGKREWQEGKWEHEERGWHYTEGYWR